MSVSIAPPDETSVDAGSDSKNGAAIGTRPDSAALYLAAPVSRSAIDRRASAPEVRHCATCFAAEFNGAPVDSQARIAVLLQEMSDADEYHLAGTRADGSEQVWDFVREYR